MSDRIERAIDTVTRVEGMLGSLARTSSLEKIFTHVHRMDMKRRDPLYVGGPVGKDLKSLISLAQAALGRFGA